MNVNELIIAERKYKFFDIQQKQIMFDRAVNEIERLLTPSVVPFYDSAEFAALLNKDQQI